MRERNLESATNHSIWSRPQCTPSDLGGVSHGDALRAHRLGYALRSFPHGNRNQLSRDEVWRSTFLQLPGNLTLCRFRLHEPADTTTKALRLAGP